SRTHLALLEDSQIEADPFARQEPLRKRWDAHLERQLGARDAGFAHLDPRPTDLKDVAEMNALLEHPVDREVLAELPIAEVVSAQLTLPEVVVLDRVRVGRPMGPSVVLEIRLSVAVEVQHPEPDSFLDRLLEDPGRDDLAPVRHSLRL